MADNLGADPAFVPSGPSQKMSRPVGFNRGEGLRCHYCGKFLNPLDGSRFHFVPLNQFGPEEAWWECEGSCQGDKQ